MDSNSSDKSRFAILIPTLGRGGAERIASGLGAKLPSTTLILFTNEREFPWNGEVVVLGIDLFSKRHWVYKLFSVVRGLIRLTILRRRFNFRTILSFLPFADLLNVASKGRRDFSIVSVHNTLSISTQGRSRHLLRLGLRFAYLRADHVIAVSEGVRNDLIDHLHLSALGNKIQVIHNPIPVAHIERGAAEPLSTELSRFFENSKVILNVGRLVRQKGQDLLLAAFSRLEKEIQEDVILVVAGDGPEASPLHAQAERLGLRVWSKLRQDNSEILTSSPPNRRPQLLFLGSVDNPFQLMANAHVFVSSSRWEGFGLVLGEALACSTPVIATDCASGPREILGPGSSSSLSPTSEDFEVVNFGILTAPPVSHEDSNDVAVRSLSAAMQFLLKQKKIHKNLKAKGALRATCFDEEITFSRWINTIKGFEVN